MNWKQFLLKLLNRINNWRSPDSDAVKKEKEKYLNDLEKRKKKALELY